MLSKQFLVKAISCSKKLQLVCCLLLRLNCVNILQVWNVMRELIIQVGADCGKEFVTVLNC